MSTRGQGDDEGNGKPGGAGGPGAGDPGMGVIRRQRRGTLEKTLRGGSGGAGTEKPNAASAWGAMLQREVRGEPPRSETSKPGVPKSESGRSESGRSGPSTAEPPAPGTTTDSGANPRVSSGTTGGLPRVAAATGGLPRVSRPSAPMPDLGALGPSVRAPSVANPEEAPPSPEESLAREARQLALAHEAHEASSRFRMLAVGSLLRIGGALLVVSSCVWLIVAPSLTLVSRAERANALAAVVADVVSRIEADPRLAAAQSDRNLAVLREIFAGSKANSVDALHAAGFPQANEDTLRVRLTDAGQAIAVSAEFTDGDGEVVAATRKTGQNPPPPPVPSVLDVMFDEYLMNLVALSFTALAAVAGLVVWPWLRTRRA